MFFVEAIFFDIDGTLVDSRDDIASAMNFTLKSLGFEDKSRDEIVSYVGTGVKYLVAKCLGQKNAALVEKATAIFSDYYLKHPTDRSRLYPNAKQVLEYFKDKRKFILTNRYSGFADATLLGLGIRDYFERIIGGDDENCLKPSACVLDKILPGLKIDKSKAVIVGDMDVDIKMGKNSNIRTCWVTYGLGGKEDVLPLGPDYVIDDMAELRNIIK